ncbi:MAG: hypothetical protein QM478_10600 [Flavobacteriaceae bacterium]
MKYTNLILKIILALPLLIFGLNKIFPEPFINMPPPQGEIAQIYMTALFSSYLAKTVAIIEVLGAILIFSKRTELLSLLLLLPITVNAFSFHLFHDLQGIIPALVVFAINIILLVKNRRQLSILIISK